MPSVPSMPIGSTPSSMRGMPIIIALPVLLAQVVFLVVTIMPCSQSLAFTTSTTSIHTTFPSLTMNARKITTFTRNFPHFSLVSRKNVLGKKSLISEFQFQSNSQIRFRHACDTRNNSINSYINNNSRWSFCCLNLYATTSGSNDEEKGQKQNWNDGQNEQVNEEDCVVYQDDEELFLQLINEKKEQQEQQEEQQHQNAAKNRVDNVIIDFDQNNGAGTPRASLQPGQVAPLLMTALQNNDFPEVDSGLRSIWDFSTDVTKYVFHNNVTEFIESCHETAKEFPTSFYGVALNGKSWRMLTNINLVGGDIDKSWIATQVMETISSDGRMRRWQWEFRKNKRPPCLGCWKVETIASSDRQGNFQAEGRGTGWED